MIETPGPTNPGGLALLSSRAMPPPDPHQGGVSTREAAAILGTSPSDVLRRIRAGELRAERFERRGGTYFRVYLNPPQDAPGATPEPESSRETGAAPEPLQDAPAATTAALEILAAALASERDERQRLASENAELRERVGRAEARLEAAERERERLSRRSMWKWWTW